MFKNEYNDTFGATYTSKVWDKPQKTNKWSMAFTLLYALSKNGMEYASANTGASSVINTTSIPCRCQIRISSPNATEGALRVWFGTRLCIKIPVVSNSDGTKAYPSGIFIADADDNILGTLCKCSGEPGNTFTKSGSTAIYTSDYAPITDWANNPDTDEDKYRIQTSTFKDKDSSYDIASVNFWAEDVYLGTITMFKAMADTNFNVLVSLKHNGDINNKVYGVYAYPLTTNTFNVYQDGYPSGDGTLYPIMWYAFGKGAQV